MAGYSHGIDGQSFDGYASRFSGTTAIEEAEVSSVGDIGVWIVVGRCSGLAAKTNKEGGLTRVNVIAVGDARLAPPDLQGILVEKLGLDTGEPVPVTESNPRSKRTHYADPVTGEILGD